MLGTIAIPETTTFRLLGIHVDNKLNWSSHISSIVHRSHKLLNLLRHVSFYLGFSSRLLFYYNFIHPILILGLPLYYLSSPSSATHPIYSVQKRAIRIITNTRLSERIRSSSLFVICGVLPLPSLATYHSAILGHSILTGSCPPYLQSHFPNSSSSRRSTRASTGHKLPSHYSYIKSVLKIVVTFNSLPLSIRSLSSSSSFKKHLKKHLLMSL